MSRKILSRRINISSVTAMIQMQKIVVSCFIFPYSLRFTQKLPFIANDAKKAQGLKRNLALYALL